jgi:hypothetical protein
MLGLIVFTDVRSGILVAPVNPQFQEVRIPDLNTRIPGEGEAATGVAVGALGGGDAVVPEVVAALGGVRFGDAGRGRAEAEDTE